MKERLKPKGQIRLYLQWPIVLSLLVLLVSVVVGAIDRKAGAVMAVFTLVYAAIAMVLYLAKKPKIVKGLVSFSAEYAWVQKKLLTEMELPYGMIDDDGRILWMNKAFAGIIQEERSSKKNLSYYFPDLSACLEKMKEDTASLSGALSGNTYRINLQRMIFEEDKDIENALGVTAEKSSLIAVYLFDETELLRYRKEISDQKLVAGLIYLDNYEEALVSVEEVRRSLLVALVDRKINKYIAQMQGIVKKLEKDKYFFAIKQQHVEKLQENRFDLLEDVKTVNIGNEMSITLSIGLGMNGTSYSQNYDYARAAIDMALGRGGDQAVVKDGEKILFYGGKSQQLEKATRVKARVKAHALRELMETKDKLLIMGHSMGDIDSFGASVGLYRIAATMNKKAHIVMNNVTASLRPMVERFTDNADYPEDMILDGPKAAELVDANTILVVVDVNRPSFTEEPALLKMVKTIVVLDHHRQTREIIENAVLSYVEPYASSTCEMVAEVVQYIADGIRMKPAEADAMYAGIVIDTNNFMNKTGVRTFEAAAFLKRSGADVVRVRKMFRDDMSDYMARAEAIHQAEVYQDVFAISTCPSEGVESPTVVGAQAANELLNIKGIKATFVFTEYSEKIYISARSIDEVNVQVIMEKFGGGGHMTIAGAQLTEVTLEEAKARLKEVLLEMLQKGEI